MEHQPENNDATVQEEVAVESPTTDEVVEQEVVEQEAVEEEVEQTIPMARFNKVYYENKQRERELAELKARMNEQQPEVTANKGDNGRPQVKPKLADFNYDDEAYAEAMVDWKLEQRDAQVQQKKIQDQQTEKVQTFVGKQAAYLDQNEDYKALTEQADRAGIIFPDSAAETIMTSDVGVKLHHHLLKNPAKIEELHGMQPVQQMRELLKLENQFSGAAAAKPKETPAVINTVSNTASGGTVSQEQRGKMSAADYYQLRMNEMKK